MKKIVSFITMVLVLITCFSTLTFAKTRNNFSIRRIEAEKITNNLANTETWVDVEYTGNGKTTVAFKFALYDEDNDRLGYSNVSSYYEFYAGDRIKIYITTPDSVNAKAINSIEIYDVYQKHDYSSDGAVSRLEINSCDVVRDVFNGGETYKLYLSITSHNKERVRVRLILKWYDYDGNVMHRGATNSILTFMPEDEKIFSLQAYSDVNIRKLDYIELIDVEFE